ncbi:MAG: flavoprotein [Victivallaceae bacterium]|nr:flavoprotein [Victivallaceae bacterium]
MKNDRLIALAVTGGIAAFKASELCSMLVKNGFEVQVLMTDNAQKFITPLTFETLTRRRVVASLWDAPDWKPEHVALADAAALFAVVPATANIIAKLACGIADDAVSTFGATFDGPTVIAPAMNPHMWSHPACQANCATLKSRGAMLVGPVAGHVACGADGVGRLIEVEKIFEAINDRLK